MMNHVPCDMLIDQGLVIGGDPCGHKCFNHATKTDGKYNICDECLLLLSGKDHLRVAIPSDEIIAYNRMLR